MPSIALMDINLEVDGDMCVAQETGDGEKISGSN